MPFTKVSPADFLLEKKNRVLFDVRSPGEFEFGHIPGAVSFPLFSDDERAQVGTVYKKNGKEKAFELGLKIVGPKMAGFVKSAKKLAPDRQIGVHCWRGGQRSGSMAWLLDSAGFEVQVLDGGYKNYRQFVRDGFGKIDLKIVILGGKTGSGKTKILHALSEIGEQIIDLERLANHKGSAFGDIGEPAQPSVEAFENQLFEEISKLDPARWVWLENESRSIGRAFIPDSFWEKMKNAPLVNIEIPLAGRVQNLVEDYTGHDPELLEKAFRKIDSKLGGAAFKSAIENVQAGNFAAAAEIALFYYDKTYRHCLEKSVSPQIRHLDFEFSDPKLIAKHLAEVF